MPSEPPSYGVLTCFGHTTVEVVLHSIRVMIYLMKGSQVDSESRRSKPTKTNFRIIKPLVLHSPHSTWHSLGQLPSAYCIPFSSGT